MKKTVQLCLLLLLFAMGMVSAYFILTERLLPFGLPPLFLSALAGAGVAGFALVHEKKQKEQGSKKFAYFLIGMVALNLMFAAAAILF